MHGTFPDIPCPPAAPRRAVVLRLAWRELRAGLGGFAVFIGCIALGVAAISGVSSVARSLVEGITVQGRVILGGDAALSLVQREASADERAFLAGQGRVSSVASLRGMANAGEAGATLVEIKAVDSQYPAVGAVGTDPARPLADLLAERDGSWGAIADPTLFERLGLSPGATLTIGTARVTLTARLVSEPDKIANGIGFGPRLLMSQEALRATGLVQPGSLVRWTYRLVLPASRDTDGDLARTLDGVRTAFPDAGWDVRTRTNADPRFTQNIERFSQFLTLVGLTALLVGGVGVANAVEAFVDRKRDSVATLKSLGASGSLVVSIYLAQVMAISALGILAGLVVGAAIPFAAAASLGSLLPIPITPVIGLPQLGLAALYGFLTALAFSIVPLGRAHDISVAGLFRDRIAPASRRPRLRYPATALAAGALLVLVAVAAAQDRRVAFVFIVVAALAFGLLRSVAVLIMAGARRLPRPRQPALRLALANLHRPGALTPSLVLSLGLGVTLLVTLATIDGSLRREIGRTLPERAPNFFFIDVPSRQASEFRAFLGGAAPGGAVEEVPMMRGRIVALKDVPVRDIKAKGDVAWVLDGDRGITYSAVIPEGSALADGAWWPADYRGPPLVSFDREIAQSFGLAVGDGVTVNVLGRTVTAKVANLRRVDWRRLGINFVMVFSPSTFAGAPHSELLTVTLPRDTAGAIEPRLLRDVARAFPAVTSVRVKDALDAVNDIVRQLVLAIRAASSVALAASLLVLAGALAAGHRARLHDAVVLKTLGATRRRLMAAYVAEYGMLGLAAATFGALAGSAAGAYVVTQIMRLGYAPSIPEVIGSALLAVSVAILLGLAGSWRILGRRPAPYLRGL